MRGPTSTSRFTLGAALAIEALSGGLGGCANRAAPHDLQVELARLREEGRALSAEIAALRSDLASLSAALESRQPDSSAVLAPPRAGAPTPANATAPVDWAGPAPRELTALLDAYAHALEKEDLDALAELYGGCLPQEDRHYLDIWFERTVGLQVQARVENVRVDDGRVLVVVRQTMTYRLRPTNELRTAHLNVRMQIESDMDGWRLSSAVLRM